MVKRDPTQEALDQLSELLQDGYDESHLNQIQKFLDHRSNHVVGKTAELIQEWELEQFKSELEANFFRFMMNPVKSDAMCVAKRSIVQCLMHLAVPAEKVYLTGLTHIQLEPVFGKPEDTAPGLRGDSGRALAKTDHPDTFRFHATLIMDSQSETRRIAVKTLTDLATIESELLLRTKILVNDTEPDIIADCFSGLMKMAPNESLEFVSNYLTSNELSTAHNAALALGESHHPQSFELLQRAWEDANLALPQYELVLPMALTRSDDAFRFLLQQLHGVTDSLMPGYLDAMSVFSGNADKNHQISEKIRSEKSSEILNYWNKIGN
jgi:hypothetical protein